MTVRAARPEELPAVMNVLDGAVLAVDAVTVRERVRDGGVLVATDGECVLGALVLDGDHIEAVAVRRRRRDQGVGTALVEAAGRRRERLTATFDADVRPFYESLGFTVEPAAEPDRFRGTRRTDC